VNKIRENAEIFEGKMIYLRFFAEKKGSDIGMGSFVLGGFIGFFEGSFFFCRKGLLDFFLCVLSPALFTTKRAETVENVSDKLF